MFVDDNRKRTDLQPRNVIPDTWTGKLRCPFCNAHPLKTIHISESPDYLLCPSCELSFEVEQHNGTIRVKNIPEQLAFAEGELKHNWIEPPLLLKLLDNRSSIMVDKSRGEAVQQLSDDEVWKRMTALYRLGNTPKMIELTLIQSGATQQQAEAAGQKLRLLSTQENKHQTNKLWLIGSLTIVLIATLFTLTWIFTNQQINSQLNQGLSKSRKNIQPNLSLRMLNDLPDVIKPEFLKGPAVSIENTGPKSANCPSRSQDAASLFGGNEGVWQRSSQPESWQMITTGKPVTIRIPKGMYAGFIDNKSFVFTSADGPATIHNVNFVIISCN